MAAPMVATTLTLLVVAYANGISGSQQAAPAQQPATLAQAETQEREGARLSFEGDTALWTVAIKPDKTADFEQILAKLRTALSTSDSPLRRQQATGWKVMRMTEPLPNGNVAYVHIINPVVAGADYAIMPILYDAFPDERQALYEQYRGAFAGNVALAVGKLAANFGSAPTPLP